MTEDRLDKIRNRLGLDKIDDRQKKEIFNEFVKAGGQVIDFEKEKNKEKLIDTKYSKSGNYYYKARNSRQSLKRTEEDERDEENNILIDRKENPVNKWLEYIGAKLTCYFTGITKFNGNDFNIRFLHNVFDKMQNGLYNSRMILASAIHQDQKVIDIIKRKIIKESSKPENFELVYRYDGLVNFRIFDEVNKYRTEKNNVNKIKRSLIEFYKELYILYPYYTSLKIAVEKVLFIEKDLKKLSQQVLVNNIRTVNSCIDFIFYNAYNKISYLIEMYYKDDCRKKTVPFTKYIDLNENDVIGILTEKWKKEIEEEDRKKEEEKKKEEEIYDINSDQFDPSKIPETLEEDVRAGYEIMMKNINLKKILNEYQENKKDIRSYFKLNDKVFITYVMMDFFDKEFSFVWNTTKIVMLSFFSSGKKIDIKKSLQDKYYEFNGVLDRATEYLKVIRDSEEVFKGASPTTKEKDQYTIMKNQISLNMRNEAKKIIKEFCNYFWMCIDDYDKEKKIIQNPEEILTFDKKLGTKRIMEGLKIIDSVKKGWQYLKFLSFLLEMHELGGTAPTLEEPFYLYLQLKDSDEIKKGSLKQSEEKNDNIKTENLDLTNDNELKGL